MSSKARIVVAFVIFIGVLFGAVYPTRTYLAQRRDLRTAHQKLALFKQQNGHLEAEAKRLESDEEIERIARARFNLVKPGEEAYAIVPVPPKPGDPASAAAAAATPPPAPAAKRSSLPDAVVDWMVSALQRVF
ncbi:MAG TPA: septum formation initiator family protein [Acidimicrobiia bacterium]|nr:septum formation initiator family protein [Acidimicrobiia bacterium]